jgi:hypothetical protein
MLKEIGVALFVLGMIFSLMCWSNNNYEGFLFEVISGPILIYAGYRLIK